MSYSYCLGFAFDDLGRVALIQKARPEWQRGLWNGVGGKIESGESAHKAMSREFCEETGVMIPDWANAGRLNGPDWFVHVFTVESRLVRDVATQGDELVALFVGGKLPHNCIENVPAMISLCRIPKERRPFFDLRYR